jgi:predicted enzyme related to lactoylglutathione lyase
MDPLDVLRTPVTPVAPDPAFAARLRARLVQALNPDPEGAAMTTLTTDRPASATVTSATDPLVTPYLAVADARRALDWYQSALGFRLRGDPIVMDDGRIGHAELELAPHAGVVMLADEFPEVGAVAPPSDPSAGVHFLLHTTVADVDAATRRAVDAGALLERAPADYPHGRTATIRDPFGHRWMLSSEVPATVAAEPAHTARHGDLTYVSLWVPDALRAGDFFSTVLGWRYEPSDDPRSRDVVGQSLSHGIWAGEPRHTMFVCIAVDDIGAAVRRVRANGGEAVDPHVEPYGTIAECSDDQGMPFAVYQATPGGGERGPVNGNGHGDVGYVTIETIDSARFRAFFGEVVGWRFSAGHVEDGWGVEDTVPMIGLHGGHDTATVVPMYRVDDIAAAVERVRAAGGTATDVEAQPYGLSSLCTDDQGTRFYLGQL